MTLQEAIEAPHSVRAYTGQPLSDEIVKVLENQMMKQNNEGQLHLQLILNEPMAFQGTMAHHGENYKCRAHYDKKSFFVQALGKYLRGVFMVVALLPPSTTCKAYASTPRSAA